jgi:hypothetical protein
LGCQVRQFRFRNNIMTRLLSRFRCVFLLSSLASCSAIASPILNYTETDLGGGFYDVLFTAVNNFDPVSNPGTNLYDIVFHFPASGFLLSLPSGWMQNFSAPGNDIEAFSGFPGSPPTGTDIAPGQSLSGFEFLFESPIGDIPFTYSFANPAQPGHPTILSGTSSTVGSGVPEPSTLLLFGTVIPLAIIVRQRAGVRKHKRLERT